jgi:5-methylcytosine-specific restriction endonuclease McrA
MPSIRSLEGTQLALDKLNSRRYREQRERVFKRDGRFCQICGTDEGEMHIDHVIPRKVGGTHDLDNLRVLCKSCNLRKGALNDGVFLAKAATPPVFRKHTSPKTTGTVPAGPCVGQTDQN